MRLCFISQSSFNKKDESYYSNPAFIKLVEMIAPLFDEVDLCVPIFNESLSRNTSELCIPNVNLCPIRRYWERFEINAFRHPLMLTRNLWPHIRHSDVVLLNIPNYISVLAWLMCLLQRKKFVIRLAGNWGEIIRMTFFNDKKYALGNIAAFLHRTLVSAGYPTGRQ